MNPLERQFFPQRGLNKYLGLGSMADEYIQGGGLFGALMNYSPHLAEAKNRLLPQAQTAAEYIGPAADMQDMKHYSGATMDDLRAGNYGNALANLGMTGAAMAMTALPGNVGAVDDASRKTIDSVFDMYLSKQKLPPKAQQSIKDALAKYADQNAVSAAQTPLERFSAFEQVLIGDGEGATVIKEIMDGAKASRQAGRWPGKIDLTSPTGLARALRQKLGGEWDSLPPGQNPYNSHYINTPDGGRVRVSDHIPMTARSENARDFVTVNADDAGYVVRIGDPNDAEELVFPYGSDELSNRNGLQKVLDAIERYRAKKTDLPMDTASRMKRAEEMGFGEDLYHASKQDIDALKPGYDDGLVFLTPSPEFADQWLGKGRYNQRIGAADEIGEMQDAERALREQIFDPENLNKLSGSDFDEAYDAAASEFRRRNPVMSQDAYNAIYPVRSNVQKIFDPEKDFDELAEYLEGEQVSDEVLREFKDGNYLLYENKKMVNFLKGKGYDAVWLKESRGSPSYSTLAVFDPKNVRSRHAMFDPAKKDSADLLASIGGVGLLGALGLSQSDEFNERY